MSRQIIKTAEAKLDLLEHFVYIGQDSIEAADRFLSAAEIAFEQLAQFPRMGSPREFRRRELAGLRQWSVPGFESYLIFYLPVEAGIKVIRVVHSARNLRRIFR